MGDNSKPERQNWGRMTVTLTIEHDAAVGPGWIETQLRDLLVRDWFGFSASGSPVPCWRVVATHTWGDAYPVDDSRSPLTRRLLEADEERFFAEQLWVRLANERGFIGDPPTGEEIANARREMQELANG